MLVLRKEHEKYFRRFNVVSLLGQGSFGTVYNVHDKSTDERFALKEIQINLNHFTNEILPQGITHPNILYYSPLMISKRPLKLLGMDRENNIKKVETINKKVETINKKVETINKKVETINFFEELTSNNNLQYDLNSNNNELSSSNKEVTPNNTLHYEDFSSPDMNHKEELKKIDAFNFKNNKPQVNNTIKFKKLRNIRNTDLLNLNRTRSWGVTTQMNLSNKFKRNKSADNEYFLYLKTKICSFSLRDFLDVRNKKIFGKKEEEDSTTISYEGILNTNVKIPVEEYKKSIDGNKICKIYSLNIFRYILLGLLFLHSIGIAHNDIKASNVFMDGNDSYRPRIGDHGCKTMCDKHGTQEGFYGTKEYLYCPNRTHIECDHQNSNKIHDCRSLVPILVELLYPFKTHSEMIGVMRYMKETLKVPSFFRLEYPKESDLIELILTDSNINVKSILIATDKILGVI